MSTIPSSAASAATPSPLGVPIFRAVWLASMSSNFGGLVQAVGASWLMTQLSGSAQKVALVQASTALPIMLFSLIAGAVADNLDRRLVMLGAQGFMLAVSVALTLCAWAGVLTPWLLLSFTFAIGCGTAFNNPAWQASVGDMVPRAALPGAVALNSMGFNIARSVGPAIGGAIVAAAGAAAAFATNAVSYLALIAVLWRWRPEPRPQTLPRERIHLAMADGLRYVALSPRIWTVLLRGAVFGAGATAVPALMPLVARDLVTGGPLTYGVLLGAFGLGAVGGALSSGWLRRRLSTEAIVRAATAAIALGAAATGLSGAMAFTVPALMVAGAGWVLALSTFNVSVQMSAPRWVVARALALYQMATFGGMTLGAWSFGSLAETRGVDARRSSWRARSCWPAWRWGSCCRCARSRTSTWRRWAAGGSPRRRCRSRSARGPSSSPSSTAWRRRTCRPSSRRWPSGGASAAATARAAGGSCRTWATPSSGSSASTCRPGSTTCATRSGARGRTPRTSTASGRCTSSRARPGSTA